MEVLIVIADKLEIVMETKDDIQLENEKLFLKEYMENYSLNNSEVLLSSNELHKQWQQNQIREALMKGYVEMAHINLTICKECQHVEYEAQHTIERLVSGG